MIMTIIATVITTAVVCVWATAAASVAIRNQIVERQIRQIQYWQARAMKAEDPEWRQP